MKSFSIIAIAVFALIALCSSAPVANQKTELQVRFDIYNDFLANLFSGLVQTTMGSLSSLLNGLISENPLDIGKRNAETDLKLAVNPLDFLYDNILQGFFSGLVTNTFTTITNTLNNLIQTNPLQIGKRDAEADLKLDISILDFLYDNILQDLFSGLVTNTFSTISNTLNNLIQTNPLGIGKRDAEADLKLDISILDFFYDNILQDLFSGLVSNTFTTISNTLNNLIQTNPLGIGKRDAEADLKLDISIFDFLYDNILQDLFSGLVNNTFSTISNTLNNLIQTNPLGIGKRDAETDLQARIDALSFLYDNILQGFFSGLVNNTFSTISNTLNHLIHTNPLGVGKRAIANGSQ